jgi:hypothetical protein
MALTEIDLRLLARFFYKHRTQDAWWTSLLLVQHPEVQSFQLTIAQVEEVFETFAKKGFLKKAGEKKIQIHGFDFQKYLFDLSGVKELREYAKVPLWYKWLSEAWIDRIEKLKTFFIVCGVLIATAFLQAFFKKWGESSFDALKKPKVEQGATGQAP